MSRVNTIIFHRKNETLYLKTLKGKLYRIRTRLSARSTLSILSLFSAMPLNFEHVEFGTILHITGKALLWFFNFNPLCLAL